MNNQYFGGIIWTNHALHRLEDRRFPQQMALDTFNTPDKKFAGKEEGTTEFQKRFKNSWVTVIGKPNDKGEWVILSCWINPPLPGTEDAKRRDEYRAYLKAPWWKKLLISFAKQLGF